MMIADMSNTSNGNGALNNTNHNNSNNNNNNNNNNGNSDRHTNNASTTSSADDRSSVNSGGTANGGGGSVNLIINYLPQQMSQEEVRSLFASMGDIESCKLVRDKVTGQSLGYAFVNYLRSEDAQRAVSNFNGLRLQNKSIKVSFARPSSESIKGANLYISGLPKSVTQAELEEVFRPFGNIITSKILCDNVTGLSKGVGFVRFDRKNEAENAIEQVNGTSPFPGGTDPIQVKFANSPVSSVQKAVALQMAQAAQAFAPLTMLQSAAAAQAAAAAAGLTVGSTISSPRKNSALAGTVGGVGPIHHTSQMSRFRYSPLAGLPMINTVAASAGAGATNAVAGNPLIQGVSLAGMAPTSTADLLTSSAILQQMAAGGGVVPSTAAAAQQQLAMLAGGMIFSQPSTSVGGVVSAPVAGNAALAAASAAGTQSAVPGYNIFVYNLAPEAEDSMLWRLFGPFGAVLSVKAMKDFTTNKCKGYGFVTMSNYDEACAAIAALNGSQLGNRTLQVSFKS